MTFESLAADDLVTESRSCVAKTSLGEPDATLRRLHAWLTSRDFAGYEPYDLTNSVYLKSICEKSFKVSVIAAQFGRRFAGIGIRKLLAVPRSKNPKALGLLISSYCDLHNLGWDVSAQLSYLRSELKRLRSPGESLWCWGYDWTFRSLRGSSLPAYSPNCIATYFCGSALLDFTETQEDVEALQLADSVAQFITTRLKRSVDTHSHLCFSYTPADDTRIFNSSALAGAYLARVGSQTKNSHYLELARRAMAYLAARQRPDGSWPYGEAKFQAWVDSFHTGYNLNALADYRRYSGDATFDRVLERGYEYFIQAFFEGRVPRYFASKTYPIDIHVCSQAILTFCAMLERDTTALARARTILDWTLSNMQNPDGTFAYQKNRFWMNRTPFMRWGQAWMFRAMAKLAVLENLRRSEA